MKGRVCITSILLLCSLNTVALEETTTTTTVVIPANTEATVITPSSNSRSSTTITTGSPTSVTRIVTPLPEPKEIVTAPSGFIHCFTVREGWYHNIWIPDHQVCQYQNATEGKVWVSGYWSCDKYNLTNGQCTNWNWNPPRWQSKLVVY